MAALAGARDAEPGQVPGGAVHAKLLAVSRALGSKLARARILHALHS